MPRSFHDDPDVPLRGPFHRHSDMLLCRGIHNVLWQTTDVTALFFCVAGYTLWQTGVVRPDWKVNTLWQGCMKGCI